jgi:hypothetical protein
VFLEKYLQHIAALLKVAISENSCFYDLSDTGAIYITLCTSEKAQRFRGIYPLKIKAICSPK